jgi:hypothetical protein
MVRYNIQLFAKTKSTDEIAKEVIQGKWGNGDARKTKLTNANYDYSTVQTRVNEMLGVGSKTPTVSAPKAGAPSPTTNAGTNASLPEIKGVDSSLVETMGSKFQGSNGLAELEQKKNNQGAKLEDFITNTPMVDEATLAGLNTPYSKSSAVLQAEQLLQSKIDQGYAGTYKESLNNLLNDFMNREDFEYDVDKDQMFQQALASAMGSGKVAMQDTIGQASALTGGYGSTYATTAGNQAYNSFIEDAYNNLPEYYNMALAAYEAEGQQMVQQYQMLDAADTKEYGRWYDDVNLTYQQTRDMVADDYNKWNANQTMYTNSANLQLGMYGQQVNNLYNLYDVASNEYANKYGEEWNSWKQSIDSAYQMAGLQNSDAWATENLNFQKDEAERQQSNWQKTYELELASAGAKVGKNGKVEVEPEEETYKAPTQAILEGAKAAYKNGTLDSYLGMYPEYDVVAIDNYVQAPEAMTTWEKVSDGGAHIGKVDDNAVIKDTATGKKYSGKQLYDYYIDQGMTKKQAREAVKKAQKLAGVQ